jgi:diaminohydroxyphosphoribosylaminopyrimidine deaminase/5-amino-6-(5-phosphoribosylamino)uracil reductase
MVDPNPLVGGRGIEALQNAGVEVLLGVRQRTCEELNRFFCKYITTGRPFVQLKIAQTVDARICAADGSSKWITSEPARRMVHRMRADSDAVLVGIKTVLLDDPQLNVRLVKGCVPRRVVLDSGLRIPLSSRLLNDKWVSRTIVVTSEKIDNDRIKAVQSKGADVWQLPAGEDNWISLPDLLELLARNNLASLLVEGGSTVFSEFLNQKLADEIAVFIAPRFVGEGLSALNSIGVHSLREAVTLSDMKHRMVGPDLLLQGRLCYKPAGAQCLPD